ncbi:Vacuolar protein sorting-associated protein 62 [Tulasnella sp. 330]|nr:Vacuolar protein sorting-associated protein 62 [Tulasnella sp. 330]
MSSEQSGEIKAAAEQMQSSGAATTAPAQAPEYPPLPAYALTYAPLLWLHGEEHYWPGDPLLHLGRCMPQGKDGKWIPVPEELIGKTELLELPNVDKPDVYLCLAEDNPRINAKVEDLMSTKGRPDPKTRLSSSAVWIIAVDKSKIVEPGIIDIFYFYFYPYNLGNTVAFTAFGNHVGDWEHSMVRFKDGHPIAVHFSAHADGHSWAWKTVEKMENRPVAYVATGSHAMYGKNGEHYYSGVPLVGPVDYTNKGVLWDPVLNYCAASYDVASETFSPLSAAEPTATATAAPPEPGSVPSAPSDAAHSHSSQPTYNTQYTPKQIVTVLTYRGRWGNSFSDVRKNINDEGGIHKFAGEAIAFMKGGDPKAERHGIKQKLEMLKWAEGPSGPRWKSLERKGVTWNTTDLLPHLV